jgi:CheY-like chemotaxis protein
MFINAGSAPHALVAEDEASLATLIEEALGEAGFCVTCVPDGLAAIEAISRARFDILLTDVRMPNLDGVALVRHLRVSQISLPVVVLSGYMTEGNRTELLQLGVPSDAILEKPVALETLNGVLRRVLAS